MRTAKPRAGVLERPGEPPVGWRVYGRAGLLLEVADGIEARRWCAAVDGSDLEATARAGWSSVLVESSWSVGRLVESLSRVALDESTSIGGAIVEIPVVYDGDDLADVESRTGLTTAEVVSRHSAPTYSVVCLGFSRAFPYLSGLDPALRLPRRPTPRTLVPAGSVAIAADQTGIYPQASPGGWHLLGRTAVELFDEDRSPPSLVQPGDRVRFAPSGTGG